MMLNVQRSLAAFTNHYGRVRAFNPRSEIRNPKSPAFALRATARPSGPAPHASCSDYKATSMLLKQRIDTQIAFIFAGASFAYIGFVSAFIIGLFAGLVPAVLGVFGLLWIAVGAAALLNRRKSAITIDASGITIPTGNVFRLGPNLHIRRELIANIMKDESIKGRVIAIVLKNGYTVPVQARNYCGLKDFLAYCKTHGLPAA
jgi:hypothetical protein